MTRQQYMQELSQALLPYDGMIRAEIISDYEEHFTIGLREGKTETEIIASLGDVDEILAFLGEPKQTKEPINEIPTPTEVTSNQPRHVVLHGFIADIKITPSSDQNIKADYINYGSAKEKLMYTFTGEQEGDTFVLRLDQKEKWSSFFGTLVHQTPRMEIFLKVPLGLESLTIKTLSGDCAIDDISINTLRIKSASGDVDITKATFGELVMDSASGDLSLRQVKGDLSLNVASGDINVIDHQGNSVRINSASGDLSYYGHCAFINLKSASGDVSAKLKNDCDITVSTVSGDADIQLYDQSAGISALRFASVSGEIRCSHPSYQIKGSSAHHQTGKPGSNLNVRTVSGDARIS